MSGAVSKETDVSAESQPAPAAWCTDIRVTRWQGGDEVAFGELYRRFEPLLEKRVGFHRLWPLLLGVQRSDVVQEVWLAVSRSRDDFTPSGPGSFLAWVGKIADNTVIELYRRQSAHKRGGGEAGESLGEGHDPFIVPRPGYPGLETPTSKARVSELHELAREVLSDRQFLAWELVEMRDYSRDEAALALGCSGSAIRGLLMRARAMLVIRLGLRRDD